MRSVTEALEIVLERTQTLSPEMVTLGPNALGRFLAEDITSDIDSPPFAKALMDGYALRVEDVHSLPRELTVIGEIAAGRMTTTTLESGQSFRIFTGAPIPPGCTSVVQREVVEEVANDRIRLREPVEPGQFILLRGQEMTKGQAVLRGGDRVQPDTFGILSSLGKASFLGYPRPKVAIIATGDELVEPTESLQPGQIRNTNGPMLVALTARAGGEPRYLGIARDARDPLATLVREGLTNADVLILAGGVSEGKLDLVPSALKEAGVVEAFHKVAMKPGKPLFFGTKEKKLVFGLPGNPVSSFVGFELFVRPALRKQSGDRSYRPVPIALPLVREFKADNNRPTYFPATTKATPQGMQVEPLAWFGSADLAGIRGINALLVLPPGKLAFPAGHQIETILLDAN